jgi:hypothetical protein
MTSPPPNRHPFRTITAAIGIILLPSAGFLLAPSLRYQLEMHPIRAVIAASEQGWADQATKMLNRMIANNSDPHALANRFLRESIASLVAEGMILAVRSHHPQARSLLQQHMTDSRWNWYLANNNQLATQLLLYLDAKTPENWVLELLGRTPPS